MGFSRTTLPFFGFGLGYREHYRDHFRHGPPPGVGWVEVITENYFFHPKRDSDSVDTLSNSALPALEKLRADLPIAFHGVSLSIGSVDPLDLSYLDRLKRLASRIQPAWISDHLCWTGMGGENQHDLLPLPYTDEAIRLVSDKIARAQDYLGRRILIENVSSYLEFAHSEMTEWEFLTAIAERADCGILLDVNNIYVSSLNHGFDPLSYLNAIPPDRVGQIHLAGHRDEGGYCIDTHDREVCSGVWDLYREAARRLGAVNTMIEWDDDFPPWEKLVGEMETARRIWTEENARASSAPGSPELTRELLSLGSSDRRTRTFPYEKEGR